LKSSFDLHVVPVFKLFSYIKVLSLRRGPIVFYKQWPSAFVNAEVMLAAAITPQLASLAEVA
jgi:hypothetical protein